MSGHNVPWGLLDAEFGSAFETRKRFRAKGRRAIANGWGEPEARATGVDR
ncbi:MAG: hypothetical protein IIY07_07835 [Thermoguttaceae bacterium]|nr:hypothetical protein [Thermoguttaceae bacterium]